jgi:hypothetical protein
MEIARKRVNSAIRTFFSIQLCICGYPSRFGRLPSTLFYINFIQGKVVCKGSKKIVPKHLE